MKTYSELTSEQQAAALDKQVAELLTVIVEGAIRFNDKINRDDLQERIDTAIQTAEGLRTPWFAGEIIMEAVGDEIRSMAMATAEDALYAESHENVVSGVL